MRQIHLREYEKSAPISLTEGQLISLRATFPRLTIEPAIGCGGSYHLTPGSHIGVVGIPGLQINVHPKITADRLFFLLSYAVDPILWKPEQVSLEKEDSVLEIAAALFCRAVAIATRRGLLHGYQSREDSQLTLRGQVRFADQLRIRQNVLLPVELRYDEYTEDIPENQVLLSALELLRQFALRSVTLRRGLQEVMAAFHGVQRITPDRAAKMEFTFNRLNRHYEPALRLATIILRSGSPESGQRQLGATGFLVDMNLVFELFVHRALREALGIPDRDFPRGDGRLRLDDARRIRLEPDLSIWRNGECRFVGDVKYKRISVAGIEHPDIYQLLAYTIASQLPTGVLIYAKGESGDASHVVRHANKTLRIECIDLALPPHRILRDISQLSDRITSDAQSHAR